MGCCKYISTGMAEGRRRRGRSRSTPNRFLTSSFNGFTANEAFFGRDERDVFLREKRVKCK